MKKLLLTKIAVIISMFLFAQTDILPPQLVFPLNDAVKQMPDTELDWYASAGIGGVMYRVELDEDNTFPNPVVYNTELTSQKLENLLFGHTYFWRVKAIDNIGESEWSAIYSFSIFSRLLPNKPNNDEENVEPNESITWKPSISGTQVSGLSIIQCQIDTAFFWRKINQTLTTDNLFASYYLDDNNVWAVGAGGTILYYDGTSWAEQTNPSTEDLFAIDFTDSSNGWAVGESGTILYFDGTEWMEKTSPVSAHWQGLVMLDANNGWAVGSDGMIISFDGTDWTEYADSPVTGPLTAVYFIDENNGWAVGEDGVIIYYDGTEWAEQTSPSSKDLFCVSFADGNNGWAAGKSGTMLFFDGNEWSEVDIDSGIDIYFISMDGTDSGIAGGKDGFLLEYDGISWLETASGSTKILRGISSQDADHALVVGENGTLVMKSDGGFESPLSKKISANADSTKIRLSELYFGTKYFWRIRGIHNADTSKWSSVKYFTTIANVTNVGPANNSTNQMTDLTVEWENISGVFEYIIELCDDPNFSTPCLFYSDENSFTPQGLLFNNTYYWHVKAAHTQDTSDFSAVWSFETLNNIDLVSPENGSFTPEIFPTLEWMELSGVGGVEVNYDMDENFTEPVVAHLEGPKNTYKVPFALQDGMTYFWKIRAYDSGDTTNWSDTWNFTIGEDTLGINQLNQHNVKLFPNPSNGVLHIEVGGKVQGNVLFTLSNLLGEIILTEEYDFRPGINQRTIKLDELQNGLYIVQFKSGKTVYTQKVILDK
ncbi:MAG: T9SS type A sorting domain-containing protein [Bacteroidales bacterium]|nr:T9SS type A sorting domain-containing protein [Bacteroidales bacterium]MCF8404032.1 T9SS type A sorting domain-containing protein [Bacteroidales bacterium]